MEMIEGTDDIVTKAGRSDQISLMSLSRYEQDGKKNILLSEVCSFRF